MCPLGFCFLPPKAMSIPEGTRWGVSTRSLSPSSKSEILNAGGETEAGRVGGSLGRKSSKVQLVQGFLRALGYGMFVSRWDQLPDGLSGGVGSSRAGGHLNHNGVFFWTLGWERPIAWADGGGTAREAGRQSWGDQQRSHSRLFQTSWKDQLQGRPRILPGGARGL